MELLLHRGLGVLRIAITSGARGTPDGDVLRHEQRRACPAGTPARAAHVGPRDPLPGLERPLARRRSRWSGSRSRTPGSGRRRGRAESPPGPYSYDIHGIVTVLSDARLPELERFRVGSLAAEPDIRVRLGRVRFERRRAGDPLPRGLGWASACRSSMGARIEATASPLVGSLAARPLHERGGADPALDLRGARLRARARGLLRGRRQRVPGHRPHRHRQDDDEPEGCSTARPYSFLSDDLTLVCPDGRVLTYPKPLTISRHTVQAVKTPLLTRRERLALADSEPAALALGAALRADPGQARTSRRRRSTRSSSWSSRRRSTTSSGWCRAWTSRPRPSWPGWS